MARGTTSKQPSSDKCPGQQQQQQQQQHRQQARKQCAQGEGRGYLSSTAGRRSPAVADAGPISRCFRGVHPSAPSPIAVLSATIRPNSNRRARGGHLPRVKSPCYWCPSVPSTIGVLSASIRPKSNRRALGVLAPRSWSWLECSEECAVRVAMRDSALLVCGACVAVLCAAVGAFSNRKPPHPQPNPTCAPLEQQKSVDLQALAGYWYAVETIGHREEDRKRGDRYRVISSCPIMFLSQLDNSTDLRLRWEEPIGTVEYRFKVVDMSDPGFWWSVGQQNGSLAENEKYQYRHFAGTVQVMRAVSTDMVLTFCSPHSHLYSMVMSRTKNMSDDTLNKLNKLLTDRGLPLVTTLVACRGAAASLETSLALLLSAATAALLAARGARVTM